MLTTPPVYAPANPPARLAYHYDAEQCVKRHRRSSLRRLGGCVIVVGRRGCFAELLAICEMQCSIDI